MPKLEQFPLDIRIRDINLKRGRLAKEDISKHLESLPDSAAEAEELVIQDEEQESPSGEETEGMSAEHTDSEESALE